MCEKCFLTISQKAKEICERAECEGLSEMSNGMADISLLAFTCTELKSTTMFNCMLGMLTLVLVDPDKFKSITTMINVAISLADTELTTHQP
jgi:hypothetical protein